MHEHHAPGAPSGVHTRLAANFAAIEARVEAAARAAGRLSRPQILCVTKTVGAEVVRALVELGRADLGENRLQVLAPKAAALAAEPPRAVDGTALAPRWHFIGHLQRNKVGGVVAACDAVHSVDSLRLLAALADAARTRVRPLEVYLQVKLWPEEDKGGLAPDEVEPALDALARAPGLAAAGLMTMAPLLEGEAAQVAAREVFEGLAAIALGLVGRPFVHGRPWLSMGMSDDLEPAVAAGSDWLRIGRALFHGLPQVGQH